MIRPHRPLIITPSDYSKTYSLMSTGPWLHFLRTSRNVCSRFSISGISYNMMRPELCNTVNSWPIYPWNSSQSAQTWQQGRLEAMLDLYFDVHIYSRCNERGKAARHRSTRCWIPAGKEVGGAVVWGKTWVTTLLSSNILKLHKLVTFAVVA